MPALLQATTTRPSPTFTRLKQSAFLTALSRCGNKSQAAEAVGIDPATPHYWGHKNTRFAEKMAEAQALGEQVLLAEYEQLVDERAVAGRKDPQSAILTMFRMKRLDPRYKDSVNVNVATSGPVAIMLGLEAEAPPALPAPMNSPTSRVGLTKDSSLSKAQVIEMKGEKG